MNNEAAVAQNRTVLTSDPYSGRPLSPDWTPEVIGSTGAVWIDGDQDKLFTSAFAYAGKLVATLEF